MLHVHIILIPFNKSFIGKPFPIPFGILIQVLKSHISSDQYCSLVVCTKLYSLFMTHDCRLRVCQKMKLIINVVSSIGLATRTLRPCLDSCPLGLLAICLFPGFHLIGMCMSIEYRKLYHWRFTGNRGLTEHFLSRVLMDIEQY